MHCGARHLGAQFGTTGLGTRSRPRSVWRSGGANLWARLCGGRFGSSGSCAPGTQGGRGGDLPRPSPHVSLQTGGPSSSPSGIVCSGLREHLPRGSSSARQLPPLFPQRDCLEVPSFRPQPCSRLPTGCRMRLPPRPRPLPGPPLCDVCGASVWLLLTSRQAAHFTATWTTDLPSAA